MTDIAMSWEFRTDGKRIDPISVGLACEAGEYYAVNMDCYWPAVARNEWLCENVVPRLPLLGEVERTAADGSLYRFRVDMRHQAVKLRRQIAAEVRDFMLAVPGPVLWADFGAHGHVALSQLWGTFADHPQGVPMFTCELRQEWDRLGRPEMPTLAGAAHHALDDAREVLHRLRWLRLLEAGWNRIQEGGLPA